MRIFSPSKQPAFYLFYSLLRPVRVCCVRLFFLAGHIDSRGDTGVRTERYTHVPVRQVRYTLERCVKRVSEVSSGERRLCARPETRRATLAPSGRRGVASLVSLSFTPFFCLLIRSHASFGHLLRIREKYSRDRLLIFNRARDRSGCQPSPGVWCPFDTVLRRWKRRKEVCPAQKTLIRDEIYLSSPRCEFSTEDEFLAEQSRGVSKGSAIERLESVF